MLTLETIDGFSKLSRIEPEWSRFAKSSPEVTPFQLPEWLLTWWRHFGSGELRVFVFRNGNEIVAIIPCFHHEWQERRQITLIGSGISDYLEPGIPREHAPVVLQMLADYLQRERDWNICVWQDLNSSSPLRSLPIKGDCTLNVEPDMECTEAQLCGDYEQWWNQRPHGLRRNVRRYLYKARLIDEPRFCVTCNAEPEIVDALITLHSARWRKHGEPGMIVANRSQQFLREVLDRLACTDMLRLFVLRFQEKIVAVICSFPYRQRLLSYMSAFDPEYETLGFGRLLLYYSLRYAFAHHYSSWNFLRGKEPYKFDWGARSIPKCRVTITRTV